MPLTRYQIRDEYSLADPELYRAADRDDPEALLEGVAMAGLVGVLRQLGDLAEFAAEIFHDLHEEVMATAARGHGLMVRVQQLEAEVPSIEKAFLSQTNHSLFFSNAGNDWHPNLHMGQNQNLITRGDLPRFVMDSYEECRGPPRLFLLDKFDVAGAGACLKRYTDPSFFKVEAASSGMTTAEVQREKKNRKAKKKGSRWRNGETPEFQPPSHAKLHQLFLEERIENGFSNPAHVVKLKRRQLNGSLFVSKEGKSYMEKFLESSSPEQKVVHEISVDSPMRSNVDNSSESGLEILEISTVSPRKKSPQRKESTCSSPNAQDLISKPYMDKFSSDAAGREIVKVPEPADGGDADYVSPPCLLNREVEEEVAVDGEMKTEGIADGYHSDDFTSEIDNYMDALATMESEVETENENRIKNKNGFLAVKKHGRDSDGNEEKLEQRARFSDSQSFGNSSASDYGNSSFKNYRSSFSDSDTQSSSAENTAPVIDRVAEVCPSIETPAAENVALPSNQLRDEPMQTKCDELVGRNGTCIEECKIPDLGEASCNSCLTDSKPMLLPLDHGVHTTLDRLHGSEIDEAANEANKLGSKSSETDEMGEDLAYSRVVASDDLSQTLGDVQLIGSAESHLGLKDPNVVSDALLHLTDISNPTPENRSDKFLKEVLQTESADEDYSENLVNGKTGSPHSSTLPIGKPFLQSVLPEEEANSDVIPTTSLDVVDPDGIVSKADDALIANGINSEDLTPLVETQKTHNVEEQQLSELANNVSEVELDSADLGLPCSDDKRDVDEIPRAAYGMETQKTHNVEEQKLKRLIDGMPMPSIRSDAVDQDGVVSKADDALIANGNNLEDLTPVVETQKTHNVEEQQLSELASNVSEVELDTADLGLPCSDDKRDVDEIPRAAYGMETQKTHNVEEQKLKRLIDGMPMPSIRSDAVDQDGVVSKADDALIANGNNLEDLTPVVETQKTHNVEEQQLSELASNVSEVELDTADLGLPCSDDKRDVDEIPRAAYGMEIGKSSCMDAVGGDAVPLECDNYTYREDHVKLDAVVTEPVIADVSPSSAAVIGTNDDVNDVFCASPDLACSSSGNHADVQVFSGFATSDTQGMEFDDRISAECLAGTEALKQVNQPEVASADSAYRPETSDLSNSRTLDNDLELSPLKQTQNNLSDHDVTISSGLRNQWPEPEPLCGNHLLENSRDEVSPASSYLLEIGSTSEKPLQFEADQADVKSFQEDKTAFNSTKLPSEQILSLNHEDQETCEKIQSSNHLQEIRFGAPELHSEHLPCQPSAADLLTQSIGLELDGSKQAIDSLEPALLGFGFPPKVAQVNLEEMPPLPPLPPMQWRMGKPQNTSLASQRDLVEASEYAFPRLQPLVDENAQFGFPAMNTGILQHQHPFLPIVAVENGKSQEVSEQLVNNSVQPIPFSFEVPTVAGDSDSQYKCLSLEGKETMNPFLTSPEKLDERPECGSLSCEEEKAQPISIPFSPTPTIEHTNPRHDFESSQDKLIEPINQLGPETMLEDKTLRSTEQNYSEVGWQNPFETSLQPPTMEADHSQHASMASDGETPQEPDLGQRPNGNPPKLPRPRNPLIDAVVAHDKSKLRKVADRVRPHNASNVDERDSLLQQIRTKSFNLKPAMMARPSVHGPKTNLKVAAILEKAKTIRQAFAGSDEDNDSDGWSDA